VEAEEELEAPPVAPFEIDGGATKDDAPIGAIVTSLVGGILLLLSVPLKWETSYVTGFGETTELGIRSGWMIAIEAVVIILVVLSEFADRSRERLKGPARVIGVLCGMTLLYALYSLFSVLAVGEADTAGISAGIRAGPGIWLGIIGSLLCLVGQGCATLSEATLKELAEPAAKESGNAPAQSQHSETTSTELGGRVPADPGGKLSRLLELKERNLITEAEYEHKRKEIIDRL
jgi:hypothetical protein